ncbi:scavenger receptor class F member 1-like isoform X3 [Ostrea edulis]|uniref:scavenger receptor class F member 1-like isoform X3 n=1 Tax=Ostrea edulis TaxID=37623 RepID=UPI0024AFCD7F|nr:scavenger receptor class F member 1-like isoform X3 [Ostrea edulis]XP_056014622.1 scavenger receptor class F member 1-like isoform X3 [Ostrea edulis]XP_056014623.1 scavenger receptor class F member 1-like isoform X3 [Ostrea edulis]
MSGFYGENCALSCPLPYYGIQCRSKCNCSEDECHLQYGCTRSFGDCDPGVYGRYCELTCQYPGFGKNCQLTCECEEQICNPIKGCILDSSSPAAGPLAKTTTAYSLNEVNENFNTLAAEINSFIRTENVPPIKRNTATLQYAIIGLGCVCCVFLIFYIGLRIVLYIDKPQVWNRQEHEM